MYDSTLALHSASDLNLSEDANTTHFVSGLNWSETSCLVTYLVTSLPRVTRPFLNFKFPRATVIRLLQGNISDNFNYIDIFRNMICTAVHRAQSSFLSLRSRIDQSKRQWRRWIDRMPHISIRCVRGWTVRVFLSGNHGSLAAHLIKLTYSRTPGLPARVWYANSWATQVSNDRSSTLHESVGSQTYQRYITICVGICLYPIIA